MTAVEALLVLVTGFGAGVLSSTVGVASLLSFPVLVALGLPPVVANISNTLGMIPAGLLTYAEHTQGRMLTHVHSVQVQSNDDLIDLPATTRRNLELVKTLRGDDTPTLFRCSTPA